MILKILIGLAVIFVAFMLLFLYCALVLAGDEENDL